MIPLSNPTLICPTLSTFWTENVASSHSLWRFAEAPWLLASAHWAPGFKEIDLRHRKSGAHQTISASKYMGLILGIWWTGLEEWKKCLQISAGTIENQDPRVNFPHGLFWSKIGVSEFWDLSLRFPTAPPLLKPSRSKGDGNSSQQEVFFGANPGKPLNFEWIFHCYLWLPNGISVKRSRGTHEISIKFGWFPADTCMNLGLPWQITLMDSHWTSALSIHPWVSMSQIYVTDIIYTLTLCFFLSLSVSFSIYVYRLYTLR